jgi:hypothetical protein
MIIIFFKWALNFIGKYMTSFTSSIMYFMKKNYLKQKRNPINLKKLLLYPKILGTQETWRSFPQI